MYQLTCDGLPLLDWRDSDLILVNPKVNLEVNTVGEGSFTIYKNHPHYNSLKKLKSVFEVSDDYGVVFRGRATRDTVDFDHGMFVDLEGAMAYFNDSVVRPFNFPSDFEEDASYIAANKNGERVAFFLGWLIDNHNSQVQDFQKLKLGNVTVKDSKFVRSTSECASTWSMLKSKLFNSSLGGYLCIRYEEDGNYIDYLSEFTETNSQEIVLGENLLDLKTEAEASETYSAIIPFGALELTIEGLADGNITEDIVKSGDTLYSKKAVEEYGWIYAPTEETTWDDVVDDAELLTTGVNWLTNSGSVPDNAIEAVAVDLHFTDKQVESLRIYKRVNVYSAPHGLAESFPLAKLEIELLNPQNTKITVGKTIQTLTEQQAFQQEEAKKKYSKLSKTDDAIRLEVQDEINKLSASIELSLDAISLQIQGVDDKYTALAVTLDGVTVTDDSGVTKIKGNSIETDTLYVKAANIDGTLKASQVDASDLKVSSANITGMLSANQIKMGGQVDFYESLADGSDLAGWIGYMNVSTSVGFSGSALGIKADTHAMVYAPSGNLLVASYANAYIGSTAGHIILTPNDNMSVKTYGYSLQFNDVNVAYVSSDQRLKRDINYNDSDKLIALFDSLKPVTFKMNGDEKQHIGFIAQDVVSGVESAGLGDALTAVDCKGYYSLNYGEITSVLVAKVKQLESRLGGIA